MQPAGLHPRTNVGNGVQLRIYPLGDSITNGYQSSDDNGYRIGLQRNLAGSNLLFVGSKTGGTMSNGVCSSHPFTAVILFIVLVLIYGHLVERRLEWIQGESDAASSGKRRRLTPLADFSNRGKGKAIPIFAGSKSHPTACWYERSEREPPC